MGKRREGLEEGYSRKSPLISDRSSWVVLGLSSRLGFDLLVSTSHPWMIQLIGSGIAHLFHLFVWNYEKFIQFLPIDCKLVASLHG